MPGLKVIAATEEVKSFCGWNYLLNLINLCPDDLTRGFLATIFETGGRISEVLSLTKSNFDFNSSKHFIIVRNMPVLKRYEKIGEYIDDIGRKRWKTRKKFDFRVFPIYRGEPLVKYMVKWIDKCPYEKLFPFTRVQGFLIIRNLGKKLGNKPIPGTLKKDGSRPLYSSELTPHILRVERASQLSEEYAFDNMALKQFFGWKPRKLDMSDKYAAMGWKGLALRILMIVKSEFEI